jgi:hypothetical protein
MARRRKDWCLTPGRPMTIEDSYFFTSFHRGVSVRSGTRLERSGMGRKPRRAATCCVQFALRDQGSHGSRLARWSCIGRLRSGLRLWRLRGQLKPAAIAQPSRRLQRLVSCKMSEHAQVIDRLARLAQRRLNTLAIRNYTVAASFVWRCLRGWSGCRVGFAPTGERRRHRHAQRLRVPGRRRPTRRQVSPLQRR